MSILGSDDLLSILDILAALRAPRSREDLARCVMPRLGKLVGSDITSYNEVNPVAREVAGFIDPDEFKLATLTAALERFMHDHPVIMHYQATGDGEALRISDFISQRELHDTGLYQELYRPLGVEYQISMTLPTRKPIIAALVFNRTHRDFSERDRTVLNTLRPHLTAAFDAARFTTRLQKRLARQNGVLENLPEGIVVLNGLSRIELLTQKARFWLGKYFPGPARRAGILPEELSAWLRLPMPVDDKIEVPMPVFTKRMGGDQISVRLIHSMDPGRMLILSETRPENSAKPLESLGLTPRQAEVLLHLSRGYTSEHIARQLHISVRTVHKHLELIFQILKVNSRTAACHLAHDRMRVMLIALMMLATGLVETLNLCC
jgi:DNA-binding CsgD family transcriptional regulator/PAS domain-containing protein